MQVTKRHSKKLKIDGPIRIHEVAKAKKSSSGFTNPQVLMVIDTFTKQYSDYGQVSIHNNENNNNNNGDNNNNNDPKLEISIMFIANFNDQLVVLLKEFG
ncbi:hypothetical protein ACTA71_005081 [Dictyostelium dimigraforme]